MFYASESHTGREECVIKCPLYRLCFCFAFARHWRWNGALQITLSSLSASLSQTNNWIVKRRHALMRLDGLSWNHSTESSFFFFYSFHGVMTSTRLLNHYLNRLPGDLKGFASDISGFWGFYSFKRWLRQFFDFHCETVSKCFRLKNFWLKCFWFLKLTLLKKFRGKCKKNTTRCRKSDIFFLMKVDRTKEMWLRKWLEWVSDLLGCLCCLWTRNLNRLTFK